MKKLVDTIKRNWIEYFIEFIVIIAGILSAFILNNWHEHRLGERAEYQSLKNLIAEFKSNKNELERQKNILVPIHENLTKYLQKLENDEISISDFLNSATRATTYDPAYGAVSTLISTGNIDLIKSDSLKYMLSDWPNRIENFREEGVWNGEFLRDHYEPYLREHFPNYRLLRKNSSKLTHGLAELYLKELKSGVYKNLMADATFYAWLQVYQFPDFEKYIDKIISLSEEELKYFE